MFDAPSKVTRRMPPSALIQVKTKNTFQRFFSSVGSKLSQMSAKSSQNSILSKKLDSVIKERLSRGSSKGSIQGGSFLEDAPADKIKSVKQQKGPRSSTGSKGSAGSMRSISPRASGGPRKGPLGEGSEPIGAEGGDVLLLPWNQADSRGDQSERSFPTAAKQPVEGRPVAEGEEQGSRVDGGSSGGGARDESTGGGAAREGSTGGEASDASPAPPAKIVIAPRPAKGALKGTRAKVAKMSFGLPASSQLSHQVREGRRQS